MLTCSKSVTEKLENIDIFSRLIIKTAERCHSGVFLAKLEQSLRLAFHIDFRHIFVCSEN